jgi:hypothetical protein
LGDGTNIHAQALEEADFAFFDTRSIQSSDLKEITESPVLFRVAVHKSAFNTGRWLRIGKTEIRSDLSEPQSTFIQDSLNPNRFQIYTAGEIKSATRDECEGLERCAVWEPEHVEDRIKDHFEGKPNKWVESLKMK